MDNVFTEGMMPGPDGTILRFFHEPAKNEGASINAGRAIFDTVLFVDVIAPGQQASTPRFEIERVFSEVSMKALGLSDNTKRSYKYKEYQEQIEKFKRNEEVDLGGTPLKFWPRIDRGLAATLAAVNIYTVEALANLSDANMDNVGLGARELREQAKAWLANAAGTADLSQLTNKVSEQTTENTRLQNDLSLANSRIGELERELSKYKDTAPAKAKQREPII